MKTDIHSSVGITRVREKTHFFPITSISLYPAHYETCGPVISLDGFVQDQHVFTLTLTTEEAKQFIASLTQSVNESSDPFTMHEFLTLQPATSSTSLE